jgi:hypothetical protein
VLPFGCGAIGRVASSFGLGPDLLTIGIAGGLGRALVAYCVWAAQTTFGGAEV